MRSILRVNAGWARPKPDHREDTIGSINRFAMTRGAIDATENPHYMVAACAARVRRAAALMHHWRKLTCGKPWKIRVRGRFEKQTNKKTNKQTNPLGP